ncbi:MAG TPA: hypothetical protein H9976_06285 [Candidatus Akkermansia intestinavium]|nr:hypothetical protein [Candidatus Akkermansia intestinavium]
MRNAALYTLMLGGLLAVAPLSAQSTASGNDAAQEAAMARTGVRFVVCSTAGNPLPSTLYYQAGKDEFKAVRIGGRTPSPRIRPFGGNVIRFWDKNPAAEQTEGAENERGNRANRGNRAAKPAAELPPPTLTIEVPAGTPSRALCILMPNKDGKTAPYFIAESDIPTRGMHIINMTPWNVRMSTSVKGDFSDARRNIIKPVNRKSRGFGKDSIWSFNGGNSGENGIAFLLEYQPPNSKEFRRIRSSRFAISERQSQVTLLVRDGQNVRMLTIQMPDDRRNRRN